MADYPVFEDAEWVQLDGSTTRGYNMSYDYSYYSYSYDYDDSKLEKLDDHVVVILTSIFALCVVVSCIGNFVVMSVMTCGKKRKQPLNSLMLNLALSDWSLGLLCLPFLFAYTMMSEWIFGEVMCAIIPFAQKTAQIVSIYTVMVIGIDRCRLVLFPGGKKLSAELYTATAVIIAVIWVVAVAIASPRLAYNAYLPPGNGSVGFCYEEWPGSGVKEVYVWLTFVLTYLVPLIILCACYFIVATKLWVSSVQDAEMRKKSRRTVRTLVALVILFGLCWLPANVYNLFLVTYNPHYFVTHPTTTRITRASIYTWMIFADAAFNPVVYMFLSEKFKQDVGRLMKRVKPNVGIGDARDSSYTEANGVILCEREQTESVNVSMRAL